MENQQGKPLIHISHTNAEVVGGQSHTITCSVSSSSVITDVTWIKTTAVSYEIINVDDVDRKFSGGTLSNPSLTINNIVKSDEGTYLCRATNCFGTTSSEDSVLTCKDKAEGLSKEENNYIRLYYTCLKIATKAVRLIFDREVPGHQLESFLREHRSILTSKKSNSRCTKQQESILFPGGHVVVVSTDFDFTLLYKLIRHHLTAIPPPTSGWGKEPLPEHLNETDDIERIRSFRNELSHNTKLEICDADFSTHWTDLSQVINRLSKGSLSTDVESMRTKIVDKYIKNEMEEDIRKEQKQMYKDIIELIQQVVDIKQIIVDNSNTSHIELNTQNNLPEMLSEKGLMYVASKLGFDWNQVALTLDITQAELEQIQLDNPCQVVKQITVALIRWRNRQRSRPQDTIKQLIGALEVPGRWDIIDDLRKRYGTDYI